jgi:uncharacterized membrane protein YheB (UPF0754 family)
MARDLASLLADRAADLLTDKVLEGLQGALEPVLPTAGERVAQWLQSQETRATLAERGRELLPRILEKLNVVQRILLSAGQYDRRLTEKMPEIVEDTVRTLQEIARDPSQQKRVLAVAMAALQDWREALRSDSLSAHAPEARARLRDGLESLLSRAFAALQDPDVRARLSGALSGWIASEHQTIGGLLRSALGVHETQVVDFLAERILTYLTGERAAPEAARALSGLVSRFLEDNGATSLGELLRIDDARKEMLDVFLLAQVTAIIDQRLPEILRGIDVEGLVVKKIDGLDVRDVERLLVQVIASHLKWINVFGAILGFIIGLFQLLLRLLAIS